MLSVSKAKGQISCIPNNTERYISFSLGQLQHINSTQFLIGSLDKLEAANQPKDFRVTSQYEPSEERSKLLMRKGIYAYEYVDSGESPPSRPRMPSTAGCLMSSLVRLIIPMHSRSGRPSDAGPLETIMAFLTVLMSFCLQTSLRLSVGPAWGNMAWTPPTITHALASRGITYTIKLVRAGAVDRLWPASLHQEGYMWRYLYSLQAIHQGKKTGWWVITNSSLPIQSSTSTWKISMAGIRVTSCKRTEFSG